MKLVFDSLVRGARNVRNYRFLIVIMYVFKLVWSLALLSPLYLMLWRSFGRNLRASNFLTRLDLSLVIDFVYYWRRALSIYFVVFILACGAIVLSYIFLSGGFWGILRDEVKNRSQGSKMERFFGYCGKYFWGMLRISLFSGVLYFAALVVFLFFTAILDNLAGKVSLWDMASWHMAARLLMGAILFLLVNMVGDYLRILYVENQGQRFLVTVGRTFKFLLTNLLRALSLYYLLSAGLAAAIFIFFGLHKIMNTLPGTGLMVLLIFLIQQVFVIFRSFFRLVYYSSQLVLYDRVSREADLRSE
jgi:hypothetical protein